MQQLTGRGFFSRHGSVRHCLLALTCGVMICLAGCGGKDHGTPSDDNRSGSGEITSSDPLLIGGARGDTYHFTALQNGWYCIEMMSNEVDAYLAVWFGSSADFTSETYIGHNDDGGEGQNARFNLNATAGQTYSFRCCSYAANQYGYYTWSVRKVPEPVALALTTTKATKPLYTLNEYGVHP